MSNFLALRGFISKIHILSNEIVRVTKRLAEQISVVRRDTTLYLT